MVELMVDVWGLSTNEDGFFVIGGKDVQNAQIKLPENKDRIIYRYESKQPQITNWMKNGNRGAKAIVLIYKENHKFNDIVLTESVSAIAITDKILDTIKSHLVDMVAYAELAASERCNIFEMIQPSFKNRDYMLREMDHSFIDNSLNRCSAGKIGCIPEKFKIGERTPGAENDCNGASAYFTYQSEASGSGLTLTHNVRTAPIRKSESEDDEDDDVVMIDGDTDASQCTSALSKSYYINIDKSKVSKRISDIRETAKHDKCSDSLSSPHAGNELYEVGRLNKRKRLEDPENTEELEWETKKYFKPEWIGFIDRYQGHLFPSPNEIKAKQGVWFELMINEKQPEKSKFRCRLCHKYFHSFGCSANHKNALVDGTLGSRSKNLEHLKNHAGIAGNNSKLFRNIYMIF